MSRYIDADALFIDLDGMMAVSPTGYIHGETVADMISNAPTVDVEPVRHGKWEMKSDPFGWFDDIPVCSECGHATKMREKTLYCPYCGAKMDGES